MGFDHAAERLRARLFARRAAYQALFMNRSVETLQPALRWWRPAFWRRPTGDDVAPAAAVVLRDLAHYCYACKPTLKISQVTQQSDALAMAFAEGRRDVFNRITALCNLNSDQIDRIAQARNPNDD